MNGLSITWTGIKDFKTFKIFLSPIRRAVLIWSEGLKSIGLCLRPENKYSQTKYISCHYQPVYKMLTSSLSSGLSVMVSFWWRWSLKIVAIWVDLNYSRRPQLFRLRLKLKSTPQRPLRFVEELSCSYNIIVAFVELFYHRPKPDPISGKRLYQNQDCIFSYARTFTYCVLLKINFIVPHFIHSIAN